MRHRYSTVLVVLLVSVSLAGFSQVDTSGIEVSSIETESMGADFLSLSLTDSVLYNHFDTEVKKYKSADKNVLITVALTESAQRMEFIVTFYKTVLLQGKKKNIKKAYDQSQKEIRKKYPIIDFKSKLFLKN